MTKNYLIFLIFFLFLFGGSNVSAQTSSDAIAIRVIPNPNHYSALRWYTEQKFSGVPQSILVDGYEAVRDGRTVYVNAANIDNTSNKLYTNIYLISYNQSAEIATEDIFGQILMRWKFNTNVTSSGQCNKSTTLNCYIDSGCPLGEYCLSNKAKIIRDTKRLGDLGDLETALTNYYKQKGNYPKLTAGSYIKNKTISTWPSWQKVLAQELASSLPLDPINKLGACGDPRFNSLTCWDEKAKEFADTNAVDPALNLPPLSNVFAYAADPNGTSYDLCAVMESGLVIGMGTGACSSAGDEIKITKPKVNTAPEFTSFDLPTGQIGKEYIGYISAADADGDVLTWSINTSPPTLTTAGNVNQKKVYVAIANAGTYTFSVTINDNQGAANSILTRNFTINIGNQPPVILADNLTYHASTTVPLNYQATAKDETVDYPLTYSVSVSPALASPLTNGFNLVSNTYQYTMSGNFTTANGPIYPSKDYVFTLHATDNKGMVGSKPFTVKVVNERPSIIMPLNCKEKIRVNNPYPACNIKSVDTDGNLITAYIYAGLPGGLVGNNSGQITGTPNTVGAFTVKINSRDEYGADSAVAAYALRVDNYCGDGTIQKPNTEKKDGPNNNGIEDCDGSSGVATSPADSSSSKQYNCSPKCVYQGGWCGDGACNGPETLANCSVDCLCGNGIINAPEQCDTAGGTGTGPNDQWACNSICQWTGGWCGNGHADFGFEECEGTDGIATSLIGSSINKQYSCTATCEFTGGYAGDGIVQLGSGEVCEPTGPKLACKDTYASLPAYCSGVLIDGLKTCNSDYLTWGACVVMPPVETGATSEACDTTSPPMLDYACCELSTCDGDACQCCGRPWLLAGVSAGYATPIGYSDVSFLAPINKRDASGSVIGLCNTTNLSCKLIRNTTNLRDWYIYTDHTMATFKCWK